MDRVARELKLDRAEVRARNMIRPEQMPYSVGLVFRDGKPLVYASGDFPKSQTRALALVATTRASARARRRRAPKAAISASASATTSKAPGSVRSRASPFASCRTARSRSRPARPRRDRARAPRCRRSWPTRSAAGIEDIVMTAGDTAAISQGIGAFASRQAINAGSSALIAGDNVQQADRRARRARARRAGKRDRRRGRPRHRAQRQQAVDDARRARAHGAGHAGLLVRARARRRASSTPPISRRRRRPIATARMSSRSRSIR